MKFKDIIQEIPNKPGSYQFKNKNGQVIYVGKAKDLKKRVQSYFSGSHDAKTTQLVMHIDSIEYIVTHSELDALLLELNLIKKFNPRYNIMLTDDKTYPYIEVTNETHPKLVVTRNIKKKSKLLFGPYPDVKAARDTVQLLNKIYPLRKCIRLPKKECLYYHMGQCLAPCINDVTDEQYKDIITDIKRFLKGDVRDIVSDLESKMYEASDALEFERAHEYKTTIDHIKTTTNRQKINLNDMLDRDVIGYAYNEHYLSVEVFFIRSGKISARHQHITEYYHDPLSNVEDFIAQFYQDHPIPRELFVSFELDVTTLEAFLKTKIHQPQRGDKKKLLDLAIINANETLERETKTLKRELDRTIHSIETIGEVLDIPTPYRIEAFDNSNLFGTNAVSSMVVFVNGKPSKQDYRKYKIRSEESTSDYHMMKEVLYRRYYRVLIEDLTRPDLLLVDGGKQQISAAKEILASLDLPIPIAGLVKDATHSTNALMNERYEEIQLESSSNAFHLLTRIQDEAHRFAVNYHKKLRSKGVFHSILDEIEGIGPKTKDKLLQRYKSVRYIKLATLDELHELGLNKTQAKNVVKTLKKN